MRVNNYMTKHLKNYIDFIEHLHENLHEAQFEQSRESLRQKEVNAKMEA